MLESVIRLLDVHTVCNTKDGEDSDTLYSSILFENCVVWCLNS